MIRSIKLLLEEYFNNTEQMNILLKNAEKTQKKADKDSEPRKQFLIAVLGKATYNKYENKGLFAPIPLSALHLDYRDFYYLNDEYAKNKMVPEENTKLTMKLFDYVKQNYSPKEFKLQNNGGKTMVLQTNVVFKRLDDIIDFFMFIQKSYKKTYKNENINWKMMIKKFRNYLK